MATFRFRAQVALDLRRKQDDEAQRALGAAKQATAASQRALAAEERRLSEGHAEALVHETREWDGSRVLWYRNWMVRQQQVIAAARSTLEARRHAEAAAAQGAMEARRRLRALERLRDRAWKAFQLAESRAEQKEFDVIGGLRFVARREVPEGV